MGQQAKKKMQRKSLNADLLTTIHNLSHEDKAQVLNMLMNKGTLKMQIEIPEAITQQMKIQLRKEVLAEFGEAMATFHETEGALNVSLGVIAGAAGANGGADTEIVLKDAKDSYASAYSRYETVVLEINSRPGGIHIQVADTLIEGKKELDEVFRGYIAHPEPANQKQIQAVVEKMILGIAETYAKVRIKEKKRGRPADVIKLAIGRAVLDYGEPEQYKAYEQGERLYQQLCDVPTNIRSDSHAQMLGQLKLYMVENGDYALKHKRRDLGVYIKEARALAAKPREIESGN